MRSNNKNIQRVLIGAIAVRFVFVVCIEEHGGRRERASARAREHKRKQRPGERALFRESWLWSWEIVSCSPESNRAAAVIAAGSLEERSITISLSVTFARRRYCRFRGKNRVGVGSARAWTDVRGCFLSGSELFFVFATWFNSFFLWREFLERVGAMNFRVCREDFLPLICSWSTVTTVFGEWRNKSAQFILSVSVCVKCWLLVKSEE